jgi:predicted nucleic acid-binding protein
LLVVVDTSVLIDHLRGDERAVGHLRRSVEDGDELWSVTIVRTEVLAGARAGEETVIQDLLQRLRWLDVSVALADAAGVLAGRYLRSHPGVDTVDYLVAATTIALDGHLLTLNIHHFPMFPALEPAYR